MIVKPIDLAMIQRMNDVSQIKQQENSKPLVDQQNITVQVQKDVNMKSEQVTGKDNINNDKKKFDAKDKSDNEYNSQDNRRKNKPEDDGRVFIKGQENIDFDIKI